MRLALLLDKRSCVLLQRRFGQQSSARGPWSWLQHGPDAAWWLGKLEGGDAFDRKQNEKASRL